MHKLLSNWRQIKSRLKQIALSRKDNNFLSGNTMISRNCLHLVIPLVFQYQYSSLFLKHTWPKIEHRIRRLKFISSKSRNWRYDWVLCSCVTRAPYDVWPSEACSSCFAAVTSKTALSSNRNLWLICQLKLIINWVFFTRQDPVVNQSP